MTDRQKRKAGRPKVEEYKKRTTRTVRVPIAIIDEVKAITAAYRANEIDVEQVRAIINAALKNKRRKE